MSDDKYGSTGDIFENEYGLEQIAKLEARIDELTNAARALRSAQRAYMAHRGDQNLGKMVALAAKELDRVLGDS